MNKQTGMKMLALGALAIVCSIIMGKAGAEGNNALLWMSLLVGYAGMMYGFTQSRGLAIGTAIGSGTLLLINMLLKGNGIVIGCLLAVLLPSSGSAIWHYGTFLG